jgi:hypothetical protein
MKMREIGLREIFINEFEEKKGTERCVLCGRDTGIPFYRPIKDRENYVYGCGQLCGQCFSSLRHDSHYLE